MMESEKGKRKIEERESDANHIIYPFVCTYQIRAGLCLIGLIKNVETESAASRQNF